MKKTLMAFGFAVLTALVAQAVVTFSGFLVNQTGLATNQTYPINLASKDILSLSAVSIVSSTTFSSKTFIDGQVSTGSITIASVPGVSSAAATNQITVLSTTNILNSSFAMNGFVIREHVDWSRASTTSGTAKNIATALAKFPNLLASASGSIVYATAPAGAYYNSWQLRTSSPTAFTVAHLNFTGGQDNASVIINGVALRQGNAWNVGATSATAATAITAAIAANSRLSPFMSATANSPTNGIVALQAKNVGSKYNFSLAVSTPAITVSGLNTINGTASAYTINQPTITVLSHGFTLGLPVLFSGTPAITGLTNGTTYYVIPVDTNNIKLATTKGNAVAGTYITITSSATPTAKNTYTLTPMPFSADPNTGFKWQVSNDNTNWLDLNVSSYSWNTSGAATTSWAFGPVGYSYIRAFVVAPSSGGLNISINLNGTNP